MDRKLIEKFRAYLKEGKREEACRLLIEILTPSQYEQLCRRGETYANAKYGNDAGMNFWLSGLQADLVDQKEKSKNAAEAHAIEAREEASFKAVIYEDALSSLETMHEKIIPYLDEFLINYIMHDILGEPYETIG